MREEKLTRDFIAHVTENDDSQTIKEHLLETAQIAKKFASSFNNSKSGYLCGLLHDIGKYSHAFQQRIRGQNIRVDHSTAGAIECEKQFQQIGRLLAYCIAGHHVGLPDGGSVVDTKDESTLFGRLKRTPEAYQSFLNDIAVSTKPEINIHTLVDHGFSISFYTRMLFSCLVDADFLNTEAFMQGTRQPYYYNNIAYLNDQLNKKLKDFDNPKNLINIKRTEILKGCVSKAKLNKGLYTLTVPTGGGKTISSFAFALKHAQYHNMERVIYVIPYNSIIEQNAKVFKDILGDKNVLEHHSGFNYDMPNDKYSSLRLLLRTGISQWW